MAGRRTTLGVLLGGLAVASLLGGGAAQAATVTMTTGNVNAGMPNTGGTRILASFPVKGRILDVNYSVRISHNNDPDLIVALRAPNGTYVTLANSRGGTAEPNNDYGSGATSCAGVQTTFDDQAGIAFSTAGAPFAGSFIPESPLSALNGSPTLGSWEVYLYDTNAIGVGSPAGTLHCSTLKIDYQPLKKKKKKKKGKKK